MTGDDVPNDEMPNRLRPARRDTPSPSDAALAALLAGTEPPAEPAPGVRPVADFLAALKADPTGAELAGEAKALAEFRRGTAAPALSRHARHRRPRVLPPRLSSKAATAVGITALSFGALATAAVVGVLPAPVQRFAHATFDALPGTPRSAPVATQTPTEGPQPKRNVARSPQPTAQATDPVTGHAVPRLCAAYARAWEHGSPAQQVIAYRKLVTAAGGVDEVIGYCEKTVPFPERPKPHVGRRVLPGRHDSRFPHDRDGRGVPPGERTGRHGPHSNGKLSAHRTERRGQHHRRHVPGNGAPMNPTRHRAAPARS